MNNSGAHSAPNLLPASSPRTDERDDSSLEGVTATVKLLMKLIQDHKTENAKHQNDSRRMLRVAGMMTVLENVRTRIQTSQSFGNKNKEAELRRSYTDLNKPNNVPRDKKPNEPLDEKQKLRKELTASITARKSLEAMCSSLGKEKEIMSGELARKVHELSEMEELVSYLKAQNEALSTKVKDFASENKEKKTNGVETIGNMALQDRNKALSEQLLRSLDGYKSIKRKLRETQEENGAMRGTMEELKDEIGASLERIQGFKQHMEMSESTEEIDEDISELEYMFERLQLKVSKCGQKKGESAKPRRDIKNACKSPVLA